MNANERKIYLNAHSWEHPHTCCGHKCRNSALQPSFGLRLFHSCTKQLMYYGMNCSQSVSTAPLLCILFHLFLTQSKIWKWQNDDKWVARVRGEWVRYWKRSHTHGEAARCLSSTMGLVYGTVCRRTSGPQRMFRFLRVSSRHTF